MRNFAVVLLCQILGLASGWGATQPLYINSAPVHVVARPQVAPQIDATAFVNQSEFEVNDIYFTGLPYQTFNTRYFTNTARAWMSGDVGYRFEYASGNTRLPLQTFLNQGSITGQTFVLISATNVTSTGPLVASQSGLVRITGNTINLRGSGVQASPLFNAFLFDGYNFNGGTNYYDPIGVSDIYWGVGTNNTLNGQGGLMPLAGTAFTDPVFDVNDPNPLRFARSPQHRVVGFTGPEQLYLRNGNAGAFAYTTTTSPTSSVVQLVFVPTNSVFDSNISVRVSFAPDFNDAGADAIVEFSFPEFDIVSRTFQTNYFYFIDHTAFATNLALAKNFSANSQRPNSYELTRSKSPIFFGSVGGNTPFSASLLYNANMASNAVGVTYVAYAADVAPITYLNGGGQNVYASTDPTNYPGRIEITGDSVNLDQARIRAESTVMIKANDLAGSVVGKISAAYENLDLRTTQPQMVITNFAPTAVQRLVGQIYAWSATWRNSERTFGGGTNNVQYHVLMLDHNLVSSIQTVFNEVALHAPHIVIADPFAVRKTLLVDAPSLEVSGALTLPVTANWANSNIVNVYNFTNRGVINVAQTAYAGTDRPNPYNNYINRGTNNASAHQIRANNFENSGCLAASGVVNVQATTASISGPPLQTNIASVLVTNFFSLGSFITLQTNTTVIGAKIQANAEIHITADQLTLSNAVVSTGPSGGALFLSVNNRLTDGGQNALSYWNVGGGFNLQTAPTTGDLLGTHVTTTIAANSEVFHTWSAQDRGATTNGFRNNSALGKLTIDAGEFSLIHFSAPDTSTHKALYVDYLDLQNYATNVNTQLDIDPSLTIYFANANVQALKIDGAAKGRLRWVRSFTGPLSSSTYTYYTTGVDGEVVPTTYTFNTAVVSDRDLDSDRDGTVNGVDPTPIYTAASIGLQVLTTKAQPPQVLLRWNGLAGAVNTIQYCNTIADPGWTVLTNIIPAGPLSGPVTFRDTVPAGRAQRVYRIVVNVPSP